MFKFDTVVVRLVSMKDLKHVYDVHISNLKDTIRCLESQVDLEQARQELLELQAIVSDKQWQLYQKHCNENNH